MNTQSSTLDLAVIWQGPALLGESPLWDHRDDSLYWLDIEGLTLYRRAASSGAVESLRLPQAAGCVVLCQQGGLIAALGQGLAWIDFDAKYIEVLRGDLATPDCLMNDGKADRRGGMVFGAKHLPESEQLAGTWHLKDGEVTALSDRFTVFNGPAFSPEGKRIYFADSPTRKILTAPYDPDQGISGTPEVFAELGEGKGYPDGMTVDAEGFLWNARWDGWGLTRYAPDGSIEREIELPVRRPTSLCFGGKDLSTLYITSASTRLSPEEIAENPLAGALFALDLRRHDLDIKGLPEALVNLPEKE